MIKNERLSAYRIMWLFVFFDLPVMTKGERKIAAVFRKKLLKDGFNMIQFCVYTRHCASDESAQVHIRRTKAATPMKGHVSILKATDKQHGDIINIWGQRISDCFRDPPRWKSFT